MMVSGSGPSHGRGAEGLGRVNYRPYRRSSVSVDVTSSNHYRYSPLFVGLIFTFGSFSFFGFRQATGQAGLNIVGGLGVFS